MKVTNYKGITINVMKSDKFYKTNQYINIYFINKTKVQFVT